MLLQIPYWFGCCAYYAFMVKTLVDYGWSGSAATAAITSMTVITVIAQPIYGYLCDNYITEKKLSVIMMLLTAAVFFLLPFSLGSGSTVLVLINMGVFALTGAQIVALMDAWIVGLKQEYPSINYGYIRGTSALAFSLSAQITGAMTLAFGHSVRFWVGSVSIVIAAFIAMSLRAARHSYEGSEEEQKSHRLTGIEAIKLVFSSTKYNWLLAISFFLYFSNASMMTMIQLVIPSLGGTAAQIGTATAIMSGSEVPLMFLMAFIMKKTGFKKPLLFCSIAYVVRMCITASVVTVEGMVYVQLLQGITYAILIPLAMSYLSQILDERIRSTAVTIYMAVIVSLGGILGNLITSALLAAGYSAQTALIVFAFSSVIGMILTVFSIIRKVW